jgi:hypothetical protein
MINSIDIPLSGVLPFLLNKMKKLPNHGTAGDLAPRACVMPVALNPSIELRKVPTKLRYFNTPFSAYATLYLNGQRDKDLADRVSWRSLEKSISLCKRPSTSKNAEACYNMHHGSSDEGG